MTRGRSTGRGELECLAVMRAAKVVQRPIALARRICIARRGDLPSTGVGLLIVQIFYWLALSTWFGGVLFIALSAPVILRTIREANPVLPNVLSVNLDKQHSSLLSGTIVANLLGMLARVQFVAAAALLVVLAAQWFVINVESTQRLLAAIVRCSLYAAAVILLVYDRRFVWPRIWASRQRYIDHADEPEVANAAREQFDKYHRESVTLLSIVLFLLLGMILFGVML